MLAHSPAWKHALTLTQVTQKGLKEKPGKCWYTACMTMRDGSASSFRSEPAHGVRGLKKYLDEKEIFRMDHYLAKTLARF